MLSFIIIALQYCSANLTIAQHSHTETDITVQLSYNNTQYK